MSECINTEKFNYSAYNFSQRSLASKEILPGEIDGVTTNCCVIKPGYSCKLKVPDNRSQVLIFLKGSGAVSQNEDIYNINEISVFVPCIETQFTVIAQNSGLEYLEILMDLTEEDREEFLKVREKLPYFIKCSESKTYKEDIKSEKTINRTLVPEQLVPRFCMGSVEASGPDIVGEHEHPILDQHFFGLKGNDCIVKADKAEVSFGENVLLHIPPGSMHGVRVEEGKKLNYLWLDFFRNSDYIEWIRKVHITNNP